MQFQNSTIAQMNTGIILAKFEKDNNKKINKYQSEAELENLLIANLVSQGYERLKFTSIEDLYINLKIQIEKLNNVVFSKDEWERFENEYLDCKNDGMVEKTRKIQENYIHSFKFDNGDLKNIKIIDKQNIHNNFLQVINQVEVEGTSKNRYDVTILVNGLPLVHIELKKRGENIQQAFNQIHRYSKESFNIDHSLYKYIQIFVISNGTYTRYFANTTSRDKNNYEFTCEWADANNNLIPDLDDFTKTFLKKEYYLKF